MPPLAPDPQFALAADALGYVAGLGYGPVDPSTCADGDAAALGRLREAQHRHLEFLAQRLPPHGRCADDTVPGPAGPVRLRVLWPERPRGRTAVVHIRGGGWWSGTLATATRTMTLIAQASGLPVLSIDYRRTPEHRYPAQRDDIVHALRALADSRAGAGLDPTQVVLWGESAGATLAVAAACRLRMPPGGPSVRGLVMHYGNFAGPSGQSTARSHWVWRQYLGQAQADIRREAVAMHRDLTGLPPCWLGCGDRDPLLGDTLQFAQALSDAGVPCRTRVWPGMPHSFLSLSRFLPAARQAIEAGAQAAWGMASGSDFGPVRPMTGATERSRDASSPPIEASQPY